MCPILRSGLILAAALILSLSGSFVSAGEATKITFLYWKPSHPEVWDRLIGTFHKENPDIRIERQVGPHSSTQYHAILTQRLKNRDTSVDVFFMDVIWPPEFASAGWALELTERFPEAERREFLPGPIAANTHGGKIFGVPSFLAAGVLYYRRDLLERHGLRPPATWEEMAEQARTVVEREGDKSLQGYSAQFKQYEGLVCDMLEFIRSNGGTVLDPASGRSLLAEPPALEAVRFVRDRIVGKAAPRGVLNYEEPESLALFTQGSAVFHRNWPYAWSIVENPERSKMAGKVGIASLPAFPGHSPAPTLGGWQFGINRWSDHPEAAWRFVRFMTSHHAQKTLALETGRAPTRKSVYGDPEIRSRMSHLVDFLPAFEKAVPRPLSPVYPMMSEELQRFFSKAISDPGSDLPALAREADSRIGKLARLGGMGKP
jgi:multiple sugar transport system substrate-binding protein